MDINTITCFDDFCRELRKAGFSVGGSNGEGIFTICDYYAANVSFHTGERDTDPWEWRIRVLDETTDISYAKVFLKKSGFITEEWYPYFYTVRRKGNSFEDSYFSGSMSHMAKNVYDFLIKSETAAFDEIKRGLGIAKEDAPGFEKALIELQSGMYITMCGAQRKKSAKGEEYGWSSTCFTSAEHRFGDDMVKRAEKLTPQAAFDTIKNRILELNPRATDKAIKKFIC